MFVQDNDYRGHMEYKCHKCGIQLHEDLILWARPDGTLSTDDGLPWCEGCAPSEPDYDAEAGR